jgi:hypothetical protein
MTSHVQVIVPIVSASLADQSQLVRVVILKPLARQMFHILSRTLGELTNRRIFYLPLDRSLKPTSGVGARHRHPIQGMCPRWWYSTLPTGTYSLFQTHGL